ncbi:MAG: LysR family transcriptional regulator [Pseudomonadales bacterium]|jgi:DNA-binding transcriptional LysR family regulator
MDTELLRTFLEVRKTRHFARAADNLFLTQAAVSARIRQLESLVGQRLLTRTRNNIQLTAAGHQLVPYAESILAAWDRALVETAVGDLPLVVMGCLPSLRETYLDDWLLTLLGRHPDWRLQVTSTGTADAIARIRERTLDLGVVYEPPRTTDLWVEQLVGFDLVLVSTRPGRSLEAGLDDYVHVEWTVAHDALLAAGAGSRVRLDSARLAQRLLLRRGGSAYLAEPAIADEVRTGRLHVVPDAPRIGRVVHLIGAGDSREDPGVRELVSALHAQASG